MNFLLGSPDVREIQPRIELEEEEEQLEWALRLYREGLKRSVFPSLYCSYLHYKEQTQPGDTERPGAQGEEQSPAGDDEQSPALTAEGQHSRFSLIKFFNQLGGR